MRYGSRYGDGSKVAIKGKERDKERAKHTVFEGGINACDSIIIIIIIIIRSLIC